MCKGLVVSHPLIVSMTLFFKISNFLKCKIINIMTFSEHIGMFGMIVLCYKRILLSIQLTIVMW